MKNAITFLLVVVMTLGFSAVSIYGLGQTPSYFEMLILAYILRIYFYSVEKK